MEEEDQRIADNLPKLSSSKVLELTIFGKYFENPSNTSHLD